MRDLGVLKERIEYAERHLSASHSARERESQALMAMWRQIRDRFESQEQEIARYRSQLAEMTNVNDELSSLVDRLINSVEGGITDSGNETVPEIARLADELLQSQPASRPARAPAPRLAPAPPHATEPVPSPRRPEPEEILELDTPADPPFAEPRPTPGPAVKSSFEANLKAALAENTDDGFDEEDFDEDDDLSIPGSTLIAGESASAGIRDLVSRIENAVAAPAEKSVSQAAADEEDDDLARELRDIEALRNELNGLRNKISAGG